MAKRQKPDDSLSNKPDFSGLPKHYTEQEVADYLNVDLRIVKQLLDTGELPFVPVSQRIRKVTEEALRQYMTNPKGSHTWQTETAAAQTSASAKADLTSVSEIEINPARSASTRARVGRPFQSARLANALLREK